MIRRRPTRLLPSLILLTLAACQTATDGPPPITAWLAAQEPSHREALEAFARGINDYAAAQAEAIADDVEAVLPVTASDLLAHLQRSIHFTFLVSPDDVRGVRRRWNAGSNAWALAPSRSASGHALLVANPHLPWLDLFTWFEVQLVTPEVNVSGATLIGSPFVGIGGLTPKRAQGDWATWSGVVPGTRSDNLWTETHPYADLPRAVDPASGWLQNANDPPWTTTFPPVLDAGDYPPYMAPRFMHFRAQQSARMLMDDASITFDELVAYKLSSRMLLADRELDDLEAAVAAHGSERARRALAVLRAWDRTADAESRGGVLFAELFREIRRAGVAFAVEWDETRPLETPDGFADPAAAAAALDRAAAAVEEHHGALDVAWGDVHRLRRGGRDLPANGGPDALGIFRVVNYRPNGDGTAAAFGGDSYVAVVEFSDPVHAMTLLSYGNASQPGSPHAGDQLELFARKELRPVWYARGDRGPSRRTGNLLSRRTP